MDVITQSLAGLGFFAVYVGLSLALVAIFAMLYMFATVHDEWRLIQANNVAAAIAFAGSLIGYTLALVSAATHSLVIGEFLLWGVVGMIVQILIYWFFRAVMMRDVSARIERGEIAAGIVLATASIVGGLLNGGAMAI